MIARKPLIVEAFETLIGLPQNESRKLELINGEIVEEMPNRMHSLIAALLVKIFSYYLDAHPGVGWVFTEARIKFPYDSLNDYIPDVAVALAANHDIQNDDLNEPFTITPELVIEIQSPDQSEKFMSDKAHVYLKYGARIAIIVYPSFRAVEVRRATSMRRYFEGESIDLSDLLPGLIIAVSDIFPQFDNQ